MSRPPKITFMTTTGVNVGDEFIREGICSFLDEIFPVWEPYYVNKHNLLSLHQQIYAESCLLKDKFRDADIIIQAGAPVYWKIDGSTSYNVEWAEELWENRIFRLGPEKPILNIAAGACQPYPDFAKTFLSDAKCVGFARKVAQACRWTSVRDPLASQILYALNIEHDVLPCSAFHAARRMKHPIGETNVLGINLMPLGGHFKLREDVNGEAWSNIIGEVINDLRSRHSLRFIAHDLLEKEYMQRFASGGEEIFHSDSYSDYMAAYSQCKTVLANRVHGAVCAAGFGRPAIIVGNDTRLQIGDYIGLPSRYIGNVKSEELIDLVEKGISDKRIEHERLLDLREASAARYREAITKNLSTTFHNSEHAYSTFNYYCTDFIATLNQFAGRFGLNAVVERSSRSDYPWLWGNTLSKLDFPNASLLFFSPGLDPLPWFLASLGTKVTIAQRDGHSSTAVGKVCAETGLLVDCIQITEEKLPFSDRTFDAVITITGLPDKNAKLSEICRVLKPRGVFSVTSNVSIPATTILAMGEQTTNGSDLGQVAPNDEPLIQDFFDESNDIHQEKFPARGHILTKKLTIKDEIKKILIPRLDTFGDIVLVQGFIAALVGQLPDTEITMLVRQGYTELASLFPKALKWLTTDVNPYANPEEHDLQKIKNFILLISSQHWDLVLFTTYNRTWPEDLLAASLNTTYKVGFRTSGKAPDWIFQDLGLSSSSLFTRLVMVEENTHEAEKYQVLWNVLFPHGGIIPLPQLNVSGETAIEAETFLKTHDLLDNNFFVCCPAGTQNVAIKKWPPERFAEIIVWTYTEFRYFPLIVGHLSEEEQIKAVAQVVERQGVPVHIWLGRPGEVPVLAGLLQKSFLYVGNDTGTMHIAAAVGTPVVGVFGGGTFPRFLPLGTHSIGVAGSLSCFGCGWNCIFMDAPCIRLVSVEDVQRAIHSVSGRGQVEDNILHASHCVSLETAEFISKANQKLNLCESDRANRLQVIKKQAIQLKVTQKLDLQLREVLAENRKRLEVIEKLQIQLQESESDRAARLEVIKKLDAQLQESETDRAARLAVILELSTKIQETETCLFVKKVNTLLEKCGLKR